MSEFENVIEDLGSFGPYQIRIFVLVSLFEIPCAWAMLLPVFIGAMPKWECLITGNSSMVQNSSFIETNATVGGCTKDNRPCEGMKFSSEFTSIVTEVNSSVTKVIV